MSAFELHHGDCLCVLRGMPDNSVDAIVTDPPYGLEFMGKRWDYDVPSVEVWAECLRVLKPGGHLLAFAGTRTQHRMAVRIEDAGFEIRDMIAWVYSTGFPKSLDVSKAIDKRGGASVAWFGPWFRKWREDNGVTQKQVAALFPSKSGGLPGCVANWELGFNMPTPEQFNLIRDTFGLPFDSAEEAEREVIGQKSVGIKNAAAGGSHEYGLTATSVDITAPATDAARQWQGWGTALKPALEPITVARKPLVGTVAENVLTHGTGALNIDGCRVGDDVRVNTGMSSLGVMHDDAWKPRDVQKTVAGRWPANLIHDGSDEVLAGFPVNAPSGGVTHQPKRSGFAGFKAGRDDGTNVQRAPDTGSAARFFYCAKASKRDRDDGLDGFELQAPIHGRAAQTGNNKSLHVSDSKAPRANNHPTVKPTDLMAYLCRLVTPPGGVVLDPFMGSGSTGKAAMREGFRFIGIEREAEYIAIARARIENAVLLAKSGAEVLKPATDRDPHTADLFSEAA